MAVRRLWAVFACGTALFVADAVVRADPPKPDPKAPAGMDDKAPADDPAEPAESSGSKERGLAVGTVAPPLDVKGWVNVAEGKEPTPESLKGKVIFVEFWETKCGPCLRQMPKVESFHQRFASEGLVVVGIAWEGAVLVERTSKEHGATYPMGLDPSRAVLEAYRVKSFPTSYVIDREGKVAAVTFPSHAEADVEKALGLGIDAAGVLSDYLGAVAMKDPARTRLHLERLAEKVVGTPVDLKAFATKAGGAAPVDSKPSAKADGPKALSDLARAKGAGDAAKAKAVLDALAAGGPEKQDLGAWVRDTLAKDFPVTAKELQALVAEKRFDATIATILDRRPPSAAFDGILKSEEFQTYCAKEATVARNHGRRGLIAEQFVLRLGPDGWKPKSQESSNELFGELSSSSWQEETATHKILGIDVDGTMLTLATAGPWADRQYAAALVMESLAVGKRPDYAKVTAEAQKLRKSTLDALKAKYGG